MHSLRTPAHMCSTHTHTHTVHTHTCSHIQVYTHTTVYVQYYSAYLGMCTTPELVMNEPKHAYITCFNVYTETCLGMVMFLVQFVCEFQHLYYTIKHGAV